MAFQAVGKPSRVGTEILAAAARGWRLLPVESRGKVPLVQKWQSVATCDYGQLEEWACRFPGCNWGLATGPDSGVVVLDIDGADGRASLAALERRGLTLPPTLTVLTGRADRGEHRYFRWPLGVDIRNDQHGKIGPHIDVRGTDGFVVCPPSFHASGQQYRFFDPSFPIAELPGWVVEMLAPHQTVGATKGSQGTQAVSKGYRTVKLVSLAGTMVRRGMSSEAITAALLAENAAACNPPLLEINVRKIAEDVVKRYANASDERLHIPLIETSDDALALTFTRKHGLDLRFTAARGRWSIWNGAVWKEDTTLQVADLARSVCRSERDSSHDPRLASRITSAPTIAAVERLARADRRHAATIQQWDSDPWLLNTPSGVVDLRTSTLRAGEREDYMTKITAVGPVGECPRWMAFLAQITDGDTALQQFIQIMCGYALTGVTQEHALFFLYGTGANGKSVFLNTISAVMGDYARTAPIEAFIASPNEHHPTDLAGLQGARLITAVETEDGKHWAEAKLKALTGGDPIAARFMRQDFFVYTPQFTLIISGNHKPSLRTVDEAMRRRINLIPFKVTIPEQRRDKQLTEKLRLEWGGILSWMIRGCQAWQSRGLNAPRAVTDATEGYFESEDVLSQWMKDRCDFASICWTPAKTLHEDYRKWCETDQEQPFSMKKFAEELRSRGFKPERKSSARGFIGISLMTVVTVAPL